MTSRACRSFAAEDHDPRAASPREPSGAAVESDIDYLARRARHERELAAQAATPKAAMAHMYLAAAYAARIAELWRTPENLQNLLDRMP